MSSKTTLLPDYVGIVQNTSLSFYNLSTNLLNAIGDYLAEIEENIKFNKGLVTPDMLKAFGELYNVLNNTNFTIENYTIQGNEVIPSGVKTLDNNFKLYFIEKYLSLSDQYKERVGSLIDGNIKYFAPFSDDIGIITDVQAIMDNNVNPYFDVFNQLNSLQTNFPATISKKVSRNEMVMSKTFSYYTDAILKLNLVGLQSGTLNEYTAKTSHGTNLITDILYFKRAILNQQAFLTELFTLLGDISSFILFFKELNPQDKDPNRKAILSTYTITNLENTELTVDLLKNNISKLQLSTQQVLG